MAPASWLLVTAMIAAAASMASKPSGCPILSMIAARTDSNDARWRSPASDSGLIRPKRRFASVTVGSVPSRSGAVRADLEDTGLIDSPDAAAARANRLDIDHRHTHRQAVAQLAFGRQDRLTTADERDVEAGRPSPRSRWIVTTMLALATVAALAIFVATQPRTGDAGRELRARS